MGELGKISWNGASAPQGQSHTRNAIKAFDTFLDLSTELSQNYSLSQCCNLIEEERKQFGESYRKFIDQISKTPFIASFVIWIKKIGYMQPDTLDDAKMLLENRFIGIFNEDGATWTIGDAKNFNHVLVLTGIRCRRDWPFLRRERLVQTYLSFLDWLSSETFGYIDRLEDPDRVRTQKRKLPFSRFIEFLDALPNEKAQLVAKLLYFSEDRSLDDILKLEILQANLTDLKITWDENGSGESTEYPEHVFNDIKALSENRIFGLIFTGRQGAPLNDATIFRNFNEAAQKVGLGESFGPKKLVAND